MPPDQNTPKNPISEENSIPPSPQEPTEPVPENTAHSEPADMLPETPEAPRNSESAIPVNNDNGAKNEPEAVRPESGEAQEMPENEASNEPKQPTAQMGRNEPLPANGEVKGESSPVQTQTPKNSIREILAKAQQVIQFRKRKKLDRIMSLFLQQSKITNDEVEKFLHVSDATATRYLSILEKEGKIKQNGKTGHMVSYSRI